MTSDNNQDPIFSSQTSIMDYVTLEGIENRTGIEKENAYAFVLKELLDNATDFLETQYSGTGVIGLREQPAIPGAEVRVTILNQGNKCLRMIVSNSNEYSKTVFSKNMLSSIF